MDLSGEEGVKNLLGVLYPDTIPTVHDIDMDKIPLIGGYAYLYLWITGTAALNGILQEILKY
jgi:hypothetical protein